MLSGLQKAARSTKTTIAGIAAILVGIGNAGIAYAGETPIDWAIVIVAILSGIGLIMSKDGDKATEDIEGTKAERRDARAERKRRREKRAAKAKAIAANAESEK